MSDDLFETLGADSAVFEEEEEEPGDTGEKQNKTFLIAVGIMGGLLVLAVIAFGVWALVINPRMKAARQAALGGIQETPTVVETTVVPSSTEETPESTEVPPTPTVAPTNTPKPTPTRTPTPVIGPTATPGGEGTEATSEAASGEVTPTPTPRERRTATPTPVPTKAPASAPTPRPTPGAGTTGKTPETGFGEVVLVAIALLLVGVAFTARRLRKA
ncbi:MAG TPA: hypothetical protein PLJ78_13815 [Anaerolineae bacterium]|nr:hypothetical protein [Anaerolineae bacterium]HQK15007.1 hypothetical protein [Anaerolineae bacterium]